MADPAVAVAVKAVVAVANDERAKKAVAILIAALLTPFLLILIMILSLLSASAQHNNDAIDYSFYGGVTSDLIPEEYRQYVEAMRSSFLDLEKAIADITAMMEDGELDSLQMKSIYYALFFGSEHEMTNAGYREFADCFVEYEERTRTGTDEYGEEYEETYLVAVPITDIQAIYGKLGGITIITEEKKTNAQRIYSYAKYGQAMPGDSAPAGAAMGDGSYQALIQEATRYIGYPYVWGGSSPSTSFDCSGYICWVYTQSGVYSLPRTTAQNIFNQCTVISRAEARPGDLVFFTKTYAANTPVSHVGIYVGGTQMLHCGNPIGYANIDSNYWRSHFYAFARLK